ncbi:glutamine-hydrolyzing GMP synthase [Spirochaeta isovalerica]|uniref:GMP synthase [glutamine-hydrolyzing] n=1 Tax=Spirochaeta isovalerica TaxID=150 RepID=A0A841R5C6_9SPIO|nr:glutamine-hydrolyzing GMP synthase [Spirochaeta isovalerica]MBB6479065.1 GMP synthase (glutamine-hydrolyzing) [Spirochaeta isovalerica]
MDKILILDFGGQTSQLIGRRIRDAGVYAEIIHGDTELTDQILTSDVKGLILSGSPYSVYEEGSPRPDKKVYSLDIPVLGICYGLQVTTWENGGKVAPLHTKEYGRSAIRYRKTDCPLLKDIPDNFVSWMSHGDSLDELAPGFDLVAESEHDLPAIVENREKGFWGLQFHPEVTHCEYGSRILENFAVHICGASKGWSMDKYVEDAAERLKKQVGNEKVLLLISGGVDSTVAGGLLLKSLDPKNIYLMYIDTGMMRKNETEKVSENLKKLGAENLLIIDARDRFLGPLEGISDPETKRKSIGDTFIRVQEEEIAKHISGDYFLAQGTLYTDLIESGKGVGNKAGVIKSHHNVGTPLVEGKRKEGKIVEPLDMLYKDEVRRLGLLLGIEEKIVYRHPFPGPGLGIRIIGDVTEEKCDILREADSIYIEELHKRGLYSRIWQAFAVLLPVRSVGVTGDAREYGYVLALRAVVSHDGMTADVFDFPTKDLLEISSLITNKVKEIGRVVYDISSKPPSTIEWE